MPIYFKPNHSVCSSKGLRFVYVATTNGKIVINVETVPPKIPRMKFVFIVARTAITLKSWMN